MARCLVFPLVLLLGCPSPAKDSTPDTASNGPADVDGDGFDAESDCNDTNKAIRPDADEVCDGVDNDCDGQIDNDPVDITTWYADGDADGYGDATAHRTGCDQPVGYVADATDCNDASADYYPGAPETGCTGPDYNCNGTFDEGDGDADGYLACDDCDDANTGVHPGATEACDGLDNDCNGTIDDGAGDSVTFYADTDGDLYGDINNTVEACSLPPGYSETKNDCDDTLASVHPGADEYCNGRDDDCDGDEDEADSVDKATFYLDSDSDGYGKSTASTTACDVPAGYAADNTDCNDANGAIHPGATEYCGGTDYDCDGASNELTSADVAPYYSDADADGYYGTLVASACTAPAGTSFSDTDCDDGDPDISPAAEDVCDAVDNDCDGDVDDGLRVPSDYASIQRGINAAGSGEHVCVAAGVYYEDIDLTYKSITVEGEDGSGATVIYGTGADSVVDLGYGSAGTVLRGFTVEGGESDYGAGVYSQASGATLEDLVIAYNSCTSSYYCTGTGLYTTGDHTIKDVTVEYNESDPTAYTYLYAYGVGAYLSGGTYDIDNLVVYDNVGYLSDTTSSSSYAYGYGAGLYLNSVAGTATDIDVEYNYFYRASGSLGYANVYGGGVQISYSSLAIDGMDVLYNGAYLYGSYDNIWGGGMQDNYDTTTFDHLLLSANYADAYAIYGVGWSIYNYSTPTITNSIVSGNKGGFTTSAYNYGYGAGISVYYYAVPVLENVDIYSNKLVADSAYGGGLDLNYYAGIDANNISVCSNTLSYSTSYGGGGGAVNLYSTSYSSGYSFTYSNFYLNTTSEFYNLSTVVGADGNIAVTPGYTSTSSSDPTAWNLKLSASSSMKNAGDPALYDTDGSRSDIGGYGGAGGSW